MSDGKKFDTKYEQYKAIAEDFLFSVLPSFETEGQRQLGQAIRYSCEAGGKRIRPVLALSVCEMLDGYMELVKPFAAAIELIHTYSLIHDDLPCMDDDTYRRGKLTNHKVFGEAMALLAGDSALNLAFEVMLDKSLLYCTHKTQTGDNRTLIAVLKAAELIARGSGAGGMAGGQAIDLSGNIQNIGDLKNLQTLKTGKLISAPVLASAILCGCTDIEYAALEQYSANIGPAFQVKDDILDMFGTFEKMGKETGRDEKMGKVTFASLLGYEKANDYLTELTNAAVDSLSIFGEKAWFLIEIARYIAGREE